MRSPRGQSGAWLAGATLAATLACGKGTGGTANWCEAELADDGGPVELVLTHSPGPYYDVGAFEELLDEFEHDHPGIDVTLDPARGASVGELFGQLDGAGRGDGARSDILAVGGAFVPTLARTGAITDLEGCPSLRAPESPGPWDAIRIVDGRAFGVTAGAAPVLLVYKPESLARAGLTDPPGDLRGLRTTAESLHAAGFAQPVVWSHPELVAVLAENPLVTPSGVPAEAGRAVFDEVAGLFRDGLVADELPADVPDDIVAIGTDDVAMQVVGLGELWGISEALRTGQAPGVDVEVAPVPGPAGPGVPAFGMVYVISSTSSDDERAAAAVLLAWLDEPAQQARRHTFTDLYPTDPAALEHTAVQAWWQDHPLLADAHRLLIDGAVLEAHLLPPPLHSGAAGELRQGIVDDAVDDALATIRSTYLPRARRWDEDPAHWLACLTGASTEVCDHLDPVRPG